MTFLILSLLVELIIGHLLKEEALSTLALDEARRTSELIFENLYTKMQEGWRRSDIEKILHRLNSFHDGTTIGLYRSPLVEALYGVVPEEKAAVNKDPLIRKAMEGQELIRLLDNGKVRYLYPVKVQKRCLKCHTNAKVGDINGVIDITMPARKILVSLDRIIYYFILAGGIFLLLFFTFFYAVFKRRLVEPMVDLTGQIQHMDWKSDTEEKVHVESECKEIKTLEISFNRLMHDLRLYRDTLLESVSIDPLTGLGNLNLLKNDLPEGHHASLMLLNVDRFKELNDYYGFEIGDRLLVAIARVLESIAGEKMRAYRIGGSEFVIVNRGDFDENRIEHILETLIRLVREDPRIGNIRFSVTAGVVRGADTRHIERASLALNLAKQEQRSYEFYRNAGDLEKRYERNVEWMKRVEEALDDDRIRLFYQPIRSVHHPRACRYEVLVRLEDEEGNIHGPGEFLDVIERTRLYPRLTRRVLKKAFEAFRDCDCGFSVNLGINDMNDSETMTLIHQLLEEERRPERVTFEILESEEAKDYEKLDAFIKTVHDLGAKIAIDDFGSGYSNFNYLLKLDADYFKIDGSIVTYVVEDGKSKMLVESIVHFARKMGAETVAEYVSDERIARICRELGVDYLQGYYIGRPGPLKNICGSDPSAGQ